MLLSTETRWILDENQFKTIQNWFANKNLNFENEKYFSRQDYYLITNSDALGIKIREPKKNEKGEQESKLELKILLNDFGAQKFNNNNTGMVNSWKKYSFETIPNEGETLSIIHSFTEKITDGNWLKIEKDRLLIKFDVKQNKLVDAKNIIDEGAGIELTKFKLRDKVYLSLGIEAFSITNNCYDNFNQTMSFLFNEIKISGLNYLESLSYPQIIKN
jgi:hypothetical protein